MLSSKLKGDATVATIIKIEQNDTINNKMQSEAIKKNKMLSELMTSTEELKKTTPPSLPSHPIPSVPPQPPPSQKKILPQNKILEKSKKKKIPIGTIDTPPVPIDMHGRYQQGTTYFSPNGRLYRKQIQIVDDRKKKRLAQSEYIREQFHNIKKDIKKDNLTKLKAYYRLHAPERVNDAESILLKFKGREKILGEKISKKYKNNLILINHLSPSQKTNKKTSRNSNNSNKNKKNNINNSAINKNKKNNNNKDDKNARQQQQKEFRARQIMILWVTAFFFNIFIPTPVLRLSCV